MVKAEHRHGRIDRAIAKRNAARGRADRRRELTWPLRSHHLAGLDCDDVPIGGFVRAGTGADVDDRARVAQRRVICARKRGSSRRVWE